MYSSTNPEAPPCSSVLGTVFASNVISELVMPTFDSSLLVLMGISSGTYLGFNLPADAKQ